MKMGGRACGVEFKLHAGATGCAPIVSGESSSLPGCLYAVCGLAREYGIS